MLKSKSENVFDENESPEMMKELFALGKLTAHTPVYFKAEIIISFLKNHSLKNKWIEANPVLAELMISGSSVTTHIESLFNLPVEKKIFCLLMKAILQSRYLKSEKALCRSKVFIAKH